MGLLDQGMAKGQILISALQTPFSGSLSQDTTGLIIYNTTNKAASVANVYDQNNRLTNNASITGHDNVYFNGNGQAAYFTGTLSIDPVKNSYDPHQHSNFTSADGEVNSVETDRLVLTHSLGF